LEEYEFSREEALKLILETCLFGSEDLNEEDNAENSSPAILVRGIRV
jgi:hypothetical protein